VPTAAVNGIDVYYEIRGEGRHLLFCNGSGATLANAGMLLDPFVERFTVLGFDQRGLGMTSVPPGPYEMADYAADAAALLDHVGWDRCCVVGVSFGGMVAQELAVTHPERVVRLALVCTSPGGTHASYPLHELASMSPDEQAALGPRLLDTRFTPEYLAEHDADRVMADLMNERRRAPIDDEVRRGELAQLDARSRHDVVDRLERIACPTLVASGRYDGIAPPENGAAIASRIAGADLRVYEGGHMFFVQDASALPDILDFLDVRDARDS
jgi:pimeloyl-ACP methyl ester carboxylesterase